MNYTGKLNSPTKPLAAGTACKLDSKARLVLPWKIRELLSIGYGDCVNIQVVGKNNGGLLLNVSSFQAPADGPDTPSASKKQFVKISKNAWEEHV